MIRRPPRSTLFPYTTLLPISKTTTVLNALSAESRQEADDLLARALASGGRPWQPAQDHGFMYGVSFTDPDGQDRKSTRLNSSHANTSYAVFCLKKKTDYPPYF